MPTFYSLNCVEKEVVNHPFQTAKKEKTNELTGSNKIGQTLPNRLQAQAIVCLLIQIDKTPVNSLNSAKG
ncbi:MAG: hypothetical protein LRZ84_01255 [Desertifilum sp.]|nr:hypothetical protein [Desertifilum sp.]MDI9637053.1 hypothetical protein [Geitlerinema splendidum]NES94794.1 hypothetical protein [Desertifilum sp. SIO1I2]